MRVSMSSDWTVSRGETSDNREFETVAAELWLSNKSGAFSTRKLQTQQRRRNTEKRDSVAQLAPLAEGSPKRLKEKPSWLGMPRHSYATTASANGQWVRVKCTLIETVLEEDTGKKTCVLNIVGEKGMLQHSVYINRLRATDIRFADRSLFFRDDCLGIHGRRTEVFAAHSPSHQTLVSSAPEPLDQRQSHRRQQSGVPIFEPIYLAFESKEAVNCWNALLRSYARPEIYGGTVEPGGLYRMWRQVDLTLLSGRGLGASGKNATPDCTSTNLSLDTERGDCPNTESNSDLEVFCEILVDGLVSGRTTGQKGQVTGGAEVPIWTWHESFTFSDLPPFGNFAIRVWREKKSSPALVGTVEIGLANFRRGRFIEGWSPVVFSGPGRNDVQVGDLRLKIKVDEEIILPLEHYSTLSSILDEGNSLDLLCDLDQKMQLGDISAHILSLAVGRGTFMKNILDLAEREVENAPNPNTLFRGNTVFTKTVERAMLFFGRPFLEASVGPSIQSLCMDRVEIETDPSRKPNRQKDIEASAKLLPTWCTTFWTQIYKVRGQCPIELRRLFQCIRELVEKRFGSQAADLKWQSVSAFCFLRMIVPAILHPHLFGLHPGLPAPAQQRSLTLIAKSMQSLANLSREQKEPYMSAVEGFLKENKPAMIDYIIQISTVPPPDRGHVDVTDRYDRLHIMQALRQRAWTLPPLASEGIPMLPHLLDIPKHFAIVSSAVIRHTQNIPLAVPSRPVPSTQRSLVEAFANECFKIEAKAVNSVGRLASPATSVSRASRNSRKVSNRRRSNSPSRVGPSTEGTRRPSNSTDGRRPNGLSSPRRKSARPSTAPAAPSSSSSSTFDTPIPSPMIPSPITFAPRPGFSNDSVSLSPSSPSASFFRKRPPTSPGEHAPSSEVDTIAYPLSHPLYRTHSQQRSVSLAFDDEAAAKRRGFLRGFLARAAKNTTD